MSYSNLNNIVVHMKKEKWHRIEGPEIDIHLGLYAV